MKSCLSLLLLIIVVLPPASLARNDNDKDEHAFKIYDNMFYQGKPDTAAQWMVASNILYESVIWPHDRNYGKLPKQSDFEALVRSHIANPGPLVLDIERLPLKGPEQVVHQHMEVLATLAVWAHHAAPRKIIGYYGTGTLSKVDPANLRFVRELEKHVDAFFPPAYTFDDDRETWAKRAKSSVEEARTLSPGKPVYLYLWPQYHDHTRKEFEYINSSYWKFQLETARGLSDGIVLWSPGKFKWDNSSGWWSATERFAREIQGQDRNGD
jgi:hypothetical protein